MSEIMVKAVITFSIDVDAIRDEGIGLADMENDDTADDAEEAANFVHGMQGSPVDNFAMIVKVEHMEVI